MALTRQHMSAERNVMDDDLSHLVRQEMDRTGLDEVTATKVVSGRLAKNARPDRGIQPITNVTWKAALRAPPGPNEPTVIPPAPPRCPDCGGAGFYKELVPVSHPNFGKLFPCSCTLERRSRREMERQTAILGQLGRELGELAGKRLEGFDVSRASGEQRKSLEAGLAAAWEYVTALPRIAQGQAGWLYLWGPCGVGKSHLGAGIAYLAAEQGYRASYASTPALLRFLRDGFKDDSENARMLALQVVDLLVLDDLGAEYHRSEGDWSDQTLFELINARYLYSRATVITSNLPIADLPLDTRTKSRIRGRAREILIFGADQRGK